MNEFLNKGAGFCMANGVQLAAYYKEVFGEDICTTCQQVLYNAYFKLKKTIPSMAIFQFKDKTNMIMVFGSSIAYTQANITDEIAAKLIAGNENYAKLFIPYGAEGEKLIEAAKKGVKVEVDSNESDSETVDYSTVKLADLKALAAERNLEVTGTSKAVFIEALTASDNK